MYTFLHTYIHAYPRPLSSPVIQNSSHNNMPYWSHASIRCKGNKPAPPQQRSMLRFAHACKRTYAYACLCVCVCVYIYIYIYICSMCDYEPLGDHVDACKRTYVYTYLFVCMYVCMCMFNQWPYSLTTP